MVNTFAKKMAAVTLVEFLHLIWSLGAQPYVESESGIKRYEEENRETEADRERHTHTQRDSSNIW